MSTPAFTNGNGTGARLARGAAALDRGRAVGARRGPALRPASHYAFVIEEGLRPEDFYRERHRLIYESMLDLYTESEPIDVLTVTEHLRSRGQARGSRRRGRDRRAHGRRARRRQPAPLRPIVKEHSLLRRVLNATYEIQASVHGHDAAAPRDRRARREARCSRSPTTTDRRTSAASATILHEEIDKWQQLSAEGRSLTGTPSGFADLDDDHRRLPAGQPDHHRRAPIDGEVGARHQHGRERRAAPRAAAAGRPVLARDVRGRARPALHRLAGVDQGRRPAQGPAEGRAQVEARARRGRRATTTRRCSSTTPRTSGILDIRAKARRLHQQTRGRVRRPRADHRRLPAAHARRRAHREPRPAGRRDEPRPEDPRARARRPRHRALAAQPRRRVAHRQAPDALATCANRARSSRTPTSSCSSTATSTTTRRPPTGPGEAELIIAKHRNGGLGDVPLTFQSEYPRFLSLQRAA